MNKPFNNKWAIILGGSSGLGLATAQKLSAEGMHLIIVHRDRKGSLETIENSFNEIRKNGTKLITYNENALDTEVRKKIINDILQKLDNKNIYCLIHSIAKGNLKKMVSTTQPTIEKIDFDLTIHAMATSWWEWTKDLLENNLWEPDARNIAFTSEGNQKYIPNYAAVSAAKVTLEVLCRYMAIELAPVGIKTNVIQSGVTETPSMKMIPESEKLIQLTLSRNPFGRLTKANDIANAVFLLCLKEANWINGSILKADAGESLI